jgi:hypothetical protein
MKYKCLSKFDQNSLSDGTTLYEFGTLVLRPQRSFDTANVHQTYFDDIKVSIIPQGYKNTKGFIYNATNIPNDATMVKPFSNTYKIDKGQYHGGIANKSESQIIEDFIGYDTGGELNLIQNSNRWLRPWETASELILGRPMQECITRSILSAHRVSSAELFGIATAGKLGSSNEIVEHSEYFRKMVIQPFQNCMLPIFNKLVSIKFEKPTTFEIKPLSLFLTGDVKENPVVDDAPVVPVQVPDQQEMTVNENIKKLSGREYQGLLRIVREYNKEKITKGQATQMLMSGYGLTEEQCVAWLGEEELNYN